MENAGKLRRSRSEIVKNDRGASLVNLENNEYLSITDNINHSQNQWSLEHQRIPHDLQNQGSASPEVGRLGVILAGLILAIEHLSAAGGPLSPLSRSSPHSTINKGSLKRGRSTHFLPRSASTGQEIVRYPLHSTLLYSSEIKNCNTTKNWLTSAQLCIAYQNSWRKV